MQARSPRAKAFTVVPRKRWEVMQPASSPDPLPQAGLVPHAQGGHHHLGQDRPPDVRGQEVRWVAEGGRLTSGAGHYHSQMKRTEDRFVTYWSKKRYVNSLANRWWGSPGAGWHRVPLQAEEVPRAGAGQAPCGQALLRLQGQDTQEEVPLELNFIFVHPNKTKQKYFGLCLCFSLANVLLIQMWLILFGFT